MRSALILPLALAATAAGCGRSAYDTTEQAEIRTATRDLTLREVAAPEVEVASPVELAKAAPVQASSHRAPHARRAASAPRSRVAESVTAPTTSEPSPTSAPAPAPVTAVAAEPPDPHALAPGQTVTIIPASSSPTDGGWTDRPLPDEEQGGMVRSRGRAGGRCKPHGPGGVPRQIAGGAFR